MITRLKIALASGIATVGTFIAGFVGAYETSTLAADISPILTDTVQASISVAVSFLQANLPLIFVLSIAVGFVFYLLYKLRGAVRGR